MIEFCTKILTFEAVDEIISHDHSSQYFYILYYLPCSILQIEFF